MKTEPHSPDRRIKTRPPLLLPLIATAITFVSHISLSCSEEPVWETPNPEREFHFPSDHGNHPSFQFERWEIRCHLFSDHRRFALKATFVRLGQRPQETPNEEPFGDAHLFLAYLSLTDPVGEVFHHQQRLNRAGWNAFSLTGDLDIRNGDWRLVRSGSSLRLRGSIQSDAEIELRLHPHKRHVFLGEMSTLHDTTETALPRYHIALSKLDVEGTLQLGDDSLSVIGKASLDHEISNRVYDESSDDRDRAYLMLLNDHEIIVDIARTTSGENSGSSLIWIDPAGSVTVQKNGEFRWTQMGDWKSPRTKAGYSVTPRLETTDPTSGIERAFLIQPIAPDQEIPKGFRSAAQWEGACDVLDKETGEVVGWAFLETSRFTGNTSSGNTEGM
ncbi:lipocalin-like domain-containing protein [Verrucomicrobiales bacterium BCK34]|nr:lipocalin-like domain-containing protein [Verrucomicrobiales bacterium BCK34]